MTMIPAHTLHLAIGLPGGWEWFVILAIGLLIFGRRLPEVGRSIGQSIVEFKRGVKSVQDEIEEEASRPAQKTSDPAALPGDASGEVRTVARGEEVEPGSNAGETKPAT